MSRLIQRSAPLLKCAQTLKPIQQMRKIVKQPILNGFLDWGSTDEVGLAISESDLACSRRNMTTKRKMNPPAMASPIKKVAHGGTLSTVIRSSNKNPTPQLPRV